MRSALRTLSVNLLQIFWKKSALTRRVTPSRKRRRRRTKRTRTIKRIKRTRRIKIRKRRRTRMRRKIKRKTRTKKRRRTRRRSVAAAVSPQSAAVNVRSVAVKNS